MSKEIFISHSHSDRKVATALTDCIVDATGISYRDILCTSHTNFHARLRPGENINRTLRKRLDDCRILVPIISRESVKRNYVLFEIGGAWALEKEIMPVLIHKEMRKAMPDIIRDLNIIYAMFNSKAHIRDLILAIDSKIFEQNTKLADVEIDKAIKKCMASIKNIKIKNTSSTV